MRDGEQEGIEYHFIDGTRLKKLEQSGRVIEVQDLSDGVWPLELCDGG